MAMGPVGYRTAVRDFGPRLIEAALREFSGNRRRASRALGIQRAYLVRLIKDLDATTPARQRSFRRGWSVTWHAARQD
jgi:DNA-binding NtrC family response regulator